MSNHLLNQYIGEVVYAIFMDNGTVRFELATQPGKLLRVTDLGRVGKYPY